MSKIEKTKQIDIEARLFMFLLCLKEEKNKKYSIEECKNNIVYLFYNYDEFKSYFEENGFSNISKDLLETCRVKTTRKGTIIVLKCLCDYIIKKYNLASKSEKKFDVLAVPIDRAFVVAKEKKEELKNSKCNPEIKHQTEEMAEKFRVNNLIERGPVLKKIRKINKETYNDKGSY